MAGTKFNPQRPCRKGSDLFERIPSNALARKAEYCDVSVEHRQGLSLEFKDGELREAVPGDERGLCVRVLFRGAWGLASTNDLSAASVDRTLSSALDIAKARSAGWRPVEAVSLAEVPNERKTLNLRVRIDPRDVSIEKKVAHLAELSRAAGAVAGVRSTNAIYGEGTRSVHFISSEDSDIRSALTRTLADISMVVKNEKGILGNRAQTGGTAGWELHKRDDLAEQGAEAARSALAALFGKKAPSGRFPVVADPALTGVFAHEAVGHAVEGDIVVSGDSCLEGRMGKRVGSGLVTLVDDPTIKGAFGSFPYDDEGVRAQRKLLIDRGRMAGYILDRESARKLGFPSNGGARAEGYSARPLVRMSNTVVEAGTFSREELFEGIKLGIYAVGSRGGQVDTGKGSFQFSCREAYLIEKGEVTGPLKDLALSGGILETLKGVDAVGDDLRMADPGYCGKGQTVPVGDGGPHIWIRSAVVGGADAVISVTGVGGRGSGAGGQGPGRRASWHGDVRDVLCGCRKGRAGPSAKGTQGGRATGGRGRGRVAPVSPWPDGDILSLGERAVRLALSKGAEEAEAFLSWSVGTSVDIEGGRISHPMQSSASGISIRVLKARRHGFAYCTHEEMLESAAARAVEISALGKALPLHFPSRAACQKPRGVLDSKLTGLTPGDGIRFCSEILESTKGAARGIQVTGGGVDFGFSETAIVNSSGVAFFEKGTAISAGAYVLLKGRTPSNGFDYQSSRGLSLDFGEIGRRAARLALDGRDPAPAPNGPRTVVLTPDAVAGLLGHILVPSLYGERVGRGESVYAGALGQAIAAPELSVLDDDLLPGGMGTSASDDEGVPSRLNVLVEKGVLKGFLYDLYSAAEFGARTTASGARGSYRSPPSVAARNVVLQGKSKELEALLSEVDEGILVHEVLGAHTASPVSGDFSVSAPLLFRIRRGKLGRPLRPVMFSGNLPRLLHNVTGLGKDVRQVFAGASSLVTGSVRIKDVTVTA